MVPVLRILPLPKNTPPPPTVRRPPDNLSVPLLVRFAPSESVPFISSSAAWSTTSAPSVLPSMVPLVQLDPWGPVTCKEALGRSRVPPDTLRTEVVKELVLGPLPPL